jgi:hypothetical protein
MDATRTRRTRDRARQAWYARYRQWRFARYLGFVSYPASTASAAHWPFTPAACRGTGGPGAGRSSAVPSGAVGPTARPVPPAREIAPRDGAGGLAGRPVTVEWPAWTDGASAVCRMSRP